jgi:hypothetical protein
MMSLEHAKLFKPWYLNTWSARVAVGRDTFQSCAI